MRVISLNETSCAPSLMPSTTPVSCAGKNPLGISMYSQTVSETVARKASSVMNWCRSAMSSVRR